MSEATKALSLDLLREAVTKGAALRCRTKLQADGGDGGKVFPPTYAGGVYAVENRRVDGRVVRCVLLDSVQSQANRMEEALLDAFLPNWRELPTEGPEPSCDLPVIGVYVDKKHGWITSLTAPHRIHDAILRDSEIEDTKDGESQKVRFRKSVIGDAVVNARVWNATAFYRYCPTALLFGTWDSTAGEGLDSAKIPRAVVSEIVGVDITPGVRTGSRLDPLGIKKEAATVYRRTDGDWAAKIKREGGQVELIGATSEDELEKTKDNKLKVFGKGKPADINHGNIPPDLARFDEPDQKTRRLPDILESSPLKLRFDVEADDGRLESRTAFEGETVRIRDGAVKPGGVTLPYALHTWTLSLTQLRRLRFPADGNAKQQASQRAEEPGSKLAENNPKGQTGSPVDRHEVARTVLAALALYAFALVRERGYWLRSRCELIPQTKGEGCPAVLELIRIDGTTESFVIPEANAAKELLRQACEFAMKASSENSGEAKPAQEVAETTHLPSPGWEQRVIRLTLTEKLKKLVEASDKLAADTSTEEQEAAGAGNQG